MNSRERAVAPFAVIKTRMIPPCVRPRRLPQLVMEFSSNHLIQVENRAAVGRFSGEHERYRRQSTTLYRQIRKNPKNNKSRPNRHRLTWPQCGPVTFPGRLERHTAGRGGRLCGTQRMHEG